MVREENRGRIADDPAVAGALSATLELVAAMVAATTILTVTPTGAGILTVALVAATMVLKDKRVKRALLVGIFVAFVVIVVYFAAPLDLPQHADFWYHVMSRLLELVYVYVGTLGVTVGVIWVISKFITIVEGLGWVTLVLLIIGAASLAAQFFWFRPAFTFWGQVELIGLLYLALVAGICAGMMTVPPFWMKLRAIYHR